MSIEVDVATAHVLTANKSPKKVFQGQTHGHEGFLLSTKDAIKVLKFFPHYEDILIPFLIGDELVSEIKAQPQRFVIDFTNKDLIQASVYK